ncbi:MAG: TIGR04255 family protein [Reyranellaceae bacterium]
MNLVSDSEVKFLRPPPVPRVRYSRNFIKTAVCEMKFPIVLELESKPPTGLQKQLKRAYPLYELRHEFNLSPLPGSDKRNVYVLQSKKRDWTIQVKSDAIILETTKYADFDEFLDRFKTLLDASRDVMDSDFLTRIGFRYVNEIPIDDGTPQGWINPALCAASSADVLGTIHREHHDYGGKTDFGSYSFRHGPNLTSPNCGKDGVPIPYMLDYDYFNENHDIQDAVSFLQQANEVNFYFFQWCLGPKAFQILGDSTPKISS